MAGSTWTRRAAVWLLAAPALGCTTVDPGADFVIPEVTFDSDYFYCHVEPELIFAKNCGSGDPSQGDMANSCHFNPAAVSGMPLQMHPAVNCGGGDHPVDTSQIGTGSPAAGNLEAVSLEMNRDYRTAPLFVRPSGSNHPRPIFDPSDPQVNVLLATWASK